MKSLRPTRTLYALFRISAFIIFLLGAAAVHAIIEGYSAGCSQPGIACLFIPTREDFGLHLLCYAIMTPFMVTLVLGFNAWRRQWSRLNLLNRNLTPLVMKDDNLESLAGRLGLAGKVYLLDSADNICFCACFTSPRIYVSRAVVGKLTPGELEALLLHEKYHLEHYDPLKILLGDLAVSALFFVPALKDLFRRYLLRKELAADRSAITYQGRGQGIAGGLLKLLDEDTSGTSGVAAATESIKYRIDFMLGRQEKERLSLGHLALSLGVPVLLAVSLLIPLA